MKSKSLKIILLLVLIGVSIPMVDRDGMSYRIMSKLVFPISKQLLPQQKDILSGDFESDLTAKPKAWKWFKPELVDYQFTDKGLIVEPTEESVWWKNKNAASLYHHINGDFDVQVKVLTRKASHQASYPTQDYQFGGIIIRDPSANAILGRENHVFNVVGYRGGGLQIETKNTANGYSQVSGYDWSSGDAELRIDRTGSQFDMYARLPNSNEWVQVNSFERNDLPDTLEIGLIVYAYSNGKNRYDLTVTFEHINISQ